MDDVNAGQAESLTYGVQGEPHSSGGLVRKLKPLADGPGNWLIFGNSTSVENPLAAGSGVPHPASNLKNVKKPLQVLPYKATQKVLQQPRYEVRGSMG